MTQRTRALLHTRGPTGGIVEAWLPVMVLGRVRPTTIPNPCKTSETSPKNVRSQLVRVLVIGETKPREIEVRRLAGPV
jgi:hypothetical protein